MSKFSKIDLRRLVVSARSLYCVIEVSKIYLLSVEANPTTPPPGIFTKTYPFKSVGVVLSSLLVFAIFGVGALTKVFSAIVERVVILMVTFFSVSTGEYDAVHRYVSTHASARPIPCSVKGLQLLVEFSEPVPFRKPVVVFNVNDCVLPLRKWNQTIGLVERLNNFVSYNTSFWHVLPPRRMCFSRHFNIGGFYA